MSLPPTTPSADAAGQREKSFGLLLFDAEECLARGEAERAMVLASRAVKERPDNFTARSLVERARRELLRGRRREKLEARIREAQTLVGRGDFAAAEKIVTSALKLIPDHEAALQLFAKIKDRPRASAAEAEAERELLRLERAQAEKSLDAARAALRAGLLLRALAFVRRGLRQVPDHPELLALLKETQAQIGSLDADRTRRRALSAQVREGLDLLAEGRTDDSLRVLRAVLLEDPDHARAQAAIQEVRRAVTARRATPAAASAAARTPAPAAAAPAPAPLPPRPSPTPSRPARDRVADAERPTVPVEILLPRTLRKATPLPWILGGGAIILAIVMFVLLSGRADRTPPVAPQDHEPEAPGTTPPPAASPPVAEAGPLQELPAELRAVVEATLAGYARALESADAALLARVRPDMSAEAREARLVPFRGALNAATDLRVIEASVTGDRALVQLLATDVVVGGQGAPRPPTAETLVFERGAAGWRIVTR
ncbi:MAG TPA: hypothetical protein VFM88_03275 [Vicinamibacteria bacterium]|nr:hypothetical protein [Vicinamibacteria bacterium]